MARAKNKIELLIEAKVKDAIRELDKTEEGLNRLAKQGSKTGVIFGKMKTALGGFIGAIALKQVAGYAVELAELGDAAQQVEKPFKKLVTLAGKDAPGALAILRKAVRGTATDVELMQRAAAAMDAFTSSGLSAGEAFEATQKTMDFLYRYATKFGKNFNELMQTVFTGLQRGSALFLDDVGIMIDQTSEQFKGLDAVEKKAAIVRESLEQMARKNELLGEVTEQSNVKIKQASVEYENLKAELGKLLNEPVGEFFAGITSILKTFTNTSKSASERYTTLRATVQDSESEITELTKRYTKLKGVIHPSAQEQEELNKVIMRLAELVPGSITAVNQYGDALDINLGAVNRFLDGQRRLLRRTKEDAFEGIKENLQDALSSYDEYSKMMEKAKADREKFDKAASEGKKEIITNVTMEVDGGDLVVQTIANVRDNLKSLDEVIGDNQKKISGMQGELNGLVSELAIFYDLTNATPEGLSAELEISNEQAQLLIERFKKLAKVPDETVKTEWDKQREAVKARYAEEIKAAGDKTKEVLRLKKLEAAELAKIDQAEKEANKPKPKGLSDEDKKRKEALELQLKLNRIELDDTKDKYQKMREAVKARYDAEIKAAKGKTEIIKALRRLEADEVTKIDKQEKEERIQREREQAQKIREIRENLSLMGEEDIYKKRIMETENYYNHEIELARGNTELITLLEQEKTAKLKEIYDEWLQYKADTYLQDHELQAAFVNAAEAGYDSFINHLLDTEMTGAEKRKAIWMDMKRAFVASVADALKEYMSKKAAELLVYLTTEQGKTAAKKTGTIQRVIYDHTEQISSETNTAENTKEAASKFFAAYAKIPWVGYAIAIAAIGGMLAMLASIGKKSKGGIVTAGDLFTGMAPENEDGLIAIQKDEFVVNKDATRKNRALLEAINQNKPLPPAAQGKGMTPRPGRLSLPPGYSLSELPAPQPAPIQREFYSVERVVEKAIPVSGEFTVRTVAPDYAEVRDYHVRVNREINRPDNDYVDRNLQTEDGPF